MVTTRSKMGNEHQNEESFMDLIAMILEMRREMENMKLSTRQIGQRREQYVHLGGLRNSRNH